MHRFTVITIFPQMFESPFGFSILKRAQERDLIQIHLVNPRDYTTDRHHTTDDTPYGGGQGMVMKPEPLTAAIDAARASCPQARIILLTPRGRMFTQKDAQRLAQEKELVLICGRYEGIDERVTAFVDEEISIGDYTLSGGEPAATVVIDTVARLIPGVLGNENSSLDDSFADGRLEYPQ
ncbi:MAG: tRNA (guanosine(37)-N1)-methyltransferase TrmD, partial [Candidatus Binatia bacterium]